MVRIRSIEVRALAPDVERFRYTAFEPEVFTTTTLVRVTDDDGRPAAARTTPTRTATRTARRSRRCARSSPAWSASTPTTSRPPRPSSPTTGRRRSRPAVRSAIDIAMWDACAKATIGPPPGGTRGGEPGGRRPPSYASVALHDDEPAYLEAVAGLVDDGFGAVKLHAWGEPSRDAALIAAVRARFPTLVLMHDAEGRYDRDGADLVARACADAGVRWLEAPLPDFDLEGYRALRRRVPGVPVLAAGDALWDPRLVADVVRDPPWDAMRFDASFVGGITAGPPADGGGRRRGARRRADQLRPHGDPGRQPPPGAGVRAHDLLRAAGTAGAVGARRPATRSAPVRDGTVRCPGGPGLGIELDEAALDRATIARVVPDRRCGRERRTADQEEASMRFDGRRVIVTGASRGIGRGIVDAFLEEGARVLATDVLEEGLERMRETHPARGPARRAHRRPRATPTRWPRSCRRPSTGWAGWTSS